jgi:hypothetical protein
MHRDVAIAAGRRMHGGRVVATDGHGRLSWVERVAGPEIGDSMRDGLSLATTAKVRQPIVPLRPPLACLRCGSGRALSPGAWPRDRARLRGLGHPVTIAPPGRATPEMRGGPSQAKRGPKEPGRSEGSTVGSASVASAIVGGLRGFVLLLNLNGTVATPGDSLY